jgi:regulatory protein
MNNTDAYQYSIKLLARQDYSCHALRQKLLLKGFEPEAVEQAIQQVIQKGYLREENYLKNKIRSLASRNYSLSYIQRRLAQENLRVDSEKIEELLQGGLLPSEDDQIKKLIEKKWRLLQKKSGVPPAKIREKILSFLLSKGHSLGKCKGLLDKYLAANDIIS